MADEQQHEAFLFNVHFNGFNYRHFGVIASQILRVISEERKSLEEHEVMAMEALVDALRIEGIARALKNLVLPFHLPASMLC